MKRNFVLTSVCVSLFSTSMFGVSLRDSVETALNNNPNIIAEKKNQEAFRKYIDDREGLYLPTLDIQAYVQSGEVKEDTDDNSTSGEWGTVDGYNAAVIFRQYLYDGGQTPSQVTEVKHQYLSNKFRSLYAIENTVL